MHYCSRSRFIPAATGFMVSGLARATSGYYGFDNDGRRRSLFESLLAVVPDFWFGVDCRQSGHRKSLDPVPIFARFGEPKPHWNTAIGSTNWRTIFGSIPSEACCNLPRGLGGMCEMQFPRRRARFFCPTKMRRVPRKTGRRHCSISGTLRIPASPRNNITRTLRSSVLTRSTPADNSYVAAGSAGTAPSRTSRIRSSGPRAGAAASCTTGTRRRIGRRRAAWTPALQTRNAGKSTPSQKR